MSSKLYLVQGGIGNSENPDLDFYLIMYSDLKGNWGYIGKKGKNYWKLYTIIGKSPIVLGSSENHYYFKNFEQCIEKLQELSGCEIEIQYILTNEDIYETDDDIKSVAGSSIYSSDKSLDELINSQNWSLTPGANYKLELFLDYMNSRAKIQFSDNVINGTTFHIISNRHSARIEDLKRQIEIEKYLIRPEDIPDFDIE